MKGRPTIDTSLDTVTRNFRAPALAMICCHIVKRCAAVYSTPELERAFFASYNLEITNNLAYYN